MKKIKLKVAHGNKKIGKDTLIINITSATDCPSKKLGLCQLGKNCSKCYALKAEKQYPKCLPYRRDQERIWDHLTADQIAKQLIMIIARKKHEIKYVRFSEAGDFRTQNDVNKMIEIAKRLKAIDVIIYGYTARSDLSFVGRPDNMIIQGSGFMLDNQFTAVKKTNNRQPICQGSCFDCNLCKVAKGHSIQALYH